MAEPQNTGLEADIGVTLGKITKQLAAAEARAIRAAKKIEGDFTASNQKVVRSFQEVDGATAQVGKSSMMAGGGVRMLTQQLSQVGQQTMATGNFFQALAIQLPDMGLAFGAVGTAVGLVAGIALPMIVSAFGNAGDAGKELSTALDEVQAKVGAYAKAVADASTPLSELTNTFGSAAVRMREVNLLLAEMGQLDAASSIEALNQQLLSTFSIEGRFKPGYIADIFDVSSMFGILDEAESKVYDFIGALNAMSSAGSLVEQEAAAQNLLSSYIALAQASGDVDAEERAFVQTLGAAILEMRNQIEATEDLEQAHADVTAEQERMNSALAGAYGLYANLRMQAQALAADTAAAADQAFRLSQQRLAEGGKVYGQVGARGDPRDFMNGRESPENNTFNGSTYTPRASRGGGGGGRGKKADEPISAQDEINDLTRKFEMLGKTDAVIASMTAKYKLLDEAKKRGLDLDKAQAGSSMTLREEIEQQAATIGNLTAKYDAASERAEFFEGIQSELKDGFLDALVAGESLTGVLADVAQAFAKAALEAAIFGTGPMSGGGTNWLSGIFGGLFGGGAKAAPVPSYAGGGYTGSAARTGGLDGQGGYLAMLHPRETVLDHTKGQSVGGGGSPTINVNVTGASGDAHIAGLVQQGVTSAIRSYDSKLPVRFNQINQNPRKR